MALHALSPLSSLSGLAEVLALNQECSDGRL